MQFIITNDLIDLLDKYQKYCDLCDREVLYKDNHYIFESSLNDYKEIVNIIIDQELSDDIKNIKLQDFLRNKSNDLEERWLDYIEDNDYEEVSV